MRSNINGFTLLEVAISIVIIATVLIVLLTTHNHSLDMLNETANITKATLLANQQIVETELIGFPDIGNESGTFEEKDSSQFKWTRNVLETPFEKVRKIEISVSWGERVNEQVKLVSYLSAN